MNEEFKPLIGQVVCGVFLSKGEHYIKFELYNGTFVIWRADGDCCSESWFADIVGLHVLLGHSITNIEEIPMPEPKDGRGRQEWDQAYGILITTKLAKCNIVYRNSSNGYYGGSLSLVDSVPADTEFRKIEDDYPV